MDPFMIDEIIHHALSICSYTKLIILSQLNLKYRNMCQLFIDQYDKYLLMSELNIRVNHTILDSIHYCFTHLLILEKYDNTIRAYHINTNDKWKVINIGDNQYTINRNGGSGRYYKSFGEFFNHYKILLSYFRKL